MFKKILLTSVFLLMSSNTFAYLFDSVTAQRIDINNISPYVGINGGFNSGPWKVKSSYGVNFPTHGFKGGLFAGVSGRICPGLYLAGELFGNKGSTKSAYKIFNHSGSIGKIRTTYDYGLSFIPGYMFAPSTILYARMGVIIANVDWTQIPSTNGTGRVSSTNNVYGAQFGVGLEQLLIRHVFVRAEYDFSSYQSRVTFDNKIYPQNNEFNLGLLYKFC